MDISYLLALQEFRDGAGAFLADFFLKMTFLAELNTLIIILAIIYWAVNKDFGTYLLMGWSGSRIVNGFLKITACVYRPWIRDTRIIPYGDSMTTATGYSFPSGHSTNGAALFGGVAVKKEVPKILRGLSIAIMILIGFSRNFLGVHTPQDVVVGLASGVLVMFLAALLMKWIDANPGKDWKVLLIGVLIAVAVAVYAGVKTYPEDYVDGKLIVDGAKMANDTFKGVGYCLGFLFGWFLERRFVKFNTDVTMMQRVVRVVTGVFSYYIVSLIIATLIKDLVPGAAGTLISCFIRLFYVAFCFPCLMRGLDKLAEVKAEIKH